MCWGNEGLMSRSKEGNMNYDETIIEFLTRKITYLESFEEIIDSPLYRRKNPDAGRYLTSLQSHTINGRASPKTSQNVLVWVC